jgi:hypothetical protein
MQEYTSPGEVEVPLEENLTASLWEAVEHHPEQPIVASASVTGSSTGPPGSSSTRSSRSPRA